MQEKYRSILDSSLTHGDDGLVEGLKTFIEAIVNENVSLVISRQLLSEVGATLVQLEDSVPKAVSHFTLEVVQPRVISFEDQVVAIRQHLADIYEREQNWSEAGKVLVGIPLETGQKQYTVDFKLETYLKIARYYFIMEPARIFLKLKYINNSSTLLDCIWRTRTRCKGRPTSTALPSFRPRPRMTTSRLSTKCARGGSSTTSGSS